MVVAYMNTVILEMFFVEVMNEMLSLTYASILREVFWCTADRDKNVNVRRCFRALCVRGFVVVVVVCFVLFLTLR